MIPHNIGNLSNLHSLRLGTSKQLLNVDNLKWFSGLPKLERLNMHGVNLSKATYWTQRVFSNLPSLVDLKMSYCSLNLSAPLNDVNNISRSNLATLVLSRNHNSLSYPIIPPWIFQLPNLIYLDMSRNTLEGPIPTMSNTTKLQHIDLSYNNLNSSIPQWLYSCKHLEYVSLTANHLQDVISNSISNLTSLNTLDLRGNKLSGKIPREIANLCNIQDLNLYYNHFGGEISDSFGNMSDCFLGALEDLDLSINHLSGHLPQQFGGFRSLRSLILGHNSLSGVIPNEIGNLLSLEVLLLGDNKLSGNLPESIGKLVNLTALDIRDNMLEGVVTETHFANLSNLEDLIASGNHLTLKVSPNWIPPFKLDMLSLGSWDLGSDSRIPLWLETQKESIYELDLSSTGINGITWLWSLYSLDLSHNQLDGDLSEYLCNTMSNKTRYLNLEGNHLSGELSNCFVKWQSLRVLNLGNNQLSGRIPDSVGFLKSLEVLNLYGNNFSGHIPSSLQNCTELIKIDFSYNNLGGDIPKWIDARFYQLRFLYLRSNRFSGEICPSICQLTNLHNLFLSHNRLSGRMPTCLNNLTGFTEEGVPHEVASYYTFQERASIATKGRELTYESNLFKFKNIDLSMNNLSGDIPREITSLVELRSLNLSRNNLTGSIPDNIGNMKQLESLDFSMNSLSGKIPSSMSIMTSLSYLILSYNHLTGRIPQSTQIGSFNESSFIGNSLCGLPLRISCKNDGNSPAITQVQIQGRKSNKREIDWFYVFLSFGYAVGLSAVLSALLFKKKWREAYYGFFQKMWDNVYVYLLT
ncbi:disease resistance family protein / LRR family protein [Striga hermonthica]|uniref:Disease resistance family protein / LRR family protein n=1 Tax=Striga hermonthica TaxID=68872 RepID=A0A9N7N1G4_STRHE|nr:disease resistance family protein / LRR family protein [Striga hermonthica]